MIKVTYVTKKSYDSGGELNEITEELSDGADYKLRALALNWFVVSVEQV